MKIDINDFSRKDDLNYYMKYDNPFLSLTVKLDVTNVVNYSKIHGSFYAVLGYIITKSVNEIEELKYRLVDNELYYFDKINSSYTLISDKNKILYGKCKYNVNLNDYMDEYNKCKNRVLSSNKSDDETQNCIWFSCSPWFSYVNISTPTKNDITIPQFTWDKYVLVNDKYECNLSMVLHHGFIDGFGINKLINRINENIKIINLE